MPQEIRNVIWIASAAPPNRFGAPDRSGRYILIFGASIRQRGSGTWAVTSDRMDSFSREKLWCFWEDGALVEVMRNRGNRSLLAGTVGGNLHFGEVDWTEPQPVAKTITDRATLERWQSG